MKTLILQIDDDTHDELAELAYVLGLTVEEFLVREGMDWINTGIRFDVGDNLAARIWDTLEEAQGAAARADEVGDTAYEWHFYRMPDGRILSDASGRNRPEEEKAGNVFVTCGLSADWKGVAA